MTFAVAANEKGKKVLTMVKEYIERGHAVDAVLDVYCDTPDIDLSCEKFEAAILKIPAADVAVVRHGRWIEKTAHVRHSYFECSNCGAHENKHTAIKGRFCWSCGAIMDGDTQWLST